MALEQGESLRNLFKRLVDHLLRHRFPDGLSLSEAYLEDDFLHFGAVLLHAFHHPGFSNHDFWDNWELYHAEVKKLEEVIDDLGRHHDEEEQLSELLDLLWDGLEQQVPEFRGKEAPSFNVFSRFRDSKLAKLIPSIIRQAELSYDMALGSGHFACAANPGLEFGELANRFYQAAYPRMNSNAVFREISTKGAAGTQGEVADVLEEIHARSLPPQPMSKHERIDTAKLPARMLYDFKELTKGYRFFTNSDERSLTEGCDFWYENGGGKILSLVGVRGVELVYLDCTWEEWAE